MSSTTSFTTENILVLDYNNRMPAGYVNLDKIRHVILRILYSDKVPKRKKKSQIALFLEREIHGIQNIDLEEDYLYFTTRIGCLKNGYTIYL